MTASPEPDVPRQLSLFPEGASLRGDALAALRDLEIGRARALLDRARRTNPSLANLGFLEQAVRLLEQLLQDDAPGPALCAGVLLKVGAEACAGRIGRETARFVDDVIARHCRRSRSADLFLDAEERVPRGLVDLVLGDADAARHRLRRCLDGGRDGRADLWGWLGDACHAAERHDDANACYARALVLDASAVDFFRLRCKPLAELHEEVHEAQLVLPHAWVRGLLQVPPATAGSMRTPGDCSPRPRPTPPRRRKCGGAGSPSCSTSTARKPARTCPGARRCWRSRPTCSISSSLPAARANQSVSDTLLRSPTG